MNKFFMTGAVVLLGGTAGIVRAADAPQPAAVVNQYCVTCHSSKLRTGDLSLEKLNPDQVGPDAATWEKVVRKIRSGMMPPAGARRPERAVLDGFASNIEVSLDRVAAAKPNPGATALHRMNRVEYANAIRDLLGIEIDPATTLPADNSSEGFDNVADMLGVSPALMERYISAAAKISRLAVGDPSISPVVTTYRVHADLTQLDHIEGLPIGTRGGILIKHNFPLTGEYLFKLAMLSTNVSGIYGYTPDEKIEVTMNGERVALLDVTKNSGVKPLELKLQVPAGPQEIGIAFLKKDSFAVEDIFQPFERTTLDTFVGIQQEYTTLPHLGRVSITGPFDAKGAGDTPSRKLIFTCKPTSSSDETACAKKIVSALARRAYRRPVTDSDQEVLLGFYQSGRNKGNFETGIEMALRRILADPEFVFRIETDPDKLPAGSAHRITDVELASRLSFFLWSSIPDEELLTLASQDKLHQPAILQQQVRRMIKDHRSQALVDNFAGQWLYLRDLKNAQPDPRVFPDFDDNLRQAFLRETQLLFQTIVREDRSMLDLLDADYTFVNERLAHFYGIPNIYGTDFRKVPVADDNRRGLLGQGSLLLVTSNANRTNVVSRGKWILENILGSPAPLPPPNVPPLKEAGEPGGNMSVRQRMEMHRTNQPCAGCHKIMDPIGLSLENFDATGAWRDTDQNAKIDPSGQLVDGTKINGPADLRRALMGRSDAFLRTATEKMMVYALGRKTEYYDMPVIRAVTQNAAHDNYRFSSLVMGIVNSAPFQMRVKLPQQDSKPVADAAAIRRQDP
jgi:hypothetical protein